MIVCPGVVQADDLSTGWLDTVATVADAPNSKATHTMTTIFKPQSELAPVRQQADRLLLALNKPSIETVANTIFPTRMAATSSSPDELAARYRDAYPTIRRFPGNRSGTYFGRLVAHPDAKAPPGDQFTQVIEKLRAEIATPTPMGARYEMSVRSPKDTARRGFPCMSSCSLQLDGTHLHLLAVYRYEYLIEKGYGNYLGLARLQAYIADHAGLEVGKLTIMCGQVQADATRHSMATHLGLSKRRP